MSQFVKGVDLSTLIELEKCGAKYYDNGKEEDVLSILKKYDADTVRIRGFFVLGIVKGSYLYVCERFLKRQKDRCNQPLLQ